MGYIKQLFQSGAKLKASQLNHIEDGIEAIDKRVDTITGNANVVVRPDDAGKYLLGKQQNYKVFPKFTNGNVNEIMMEVEGSGGRIEVGGVLANYAPVGGLAFLEQTGYVTIEYLGYSVGLDRTRIDYKILGHVCSLYFPAPVEPVAIRLYNVETVHTCASDNVVANTGSTNTDVAETAKTITCEDRLIGGQADFHLHGLYCVNTTVYTESDKVTPLYFRFMVFIPEGWDGSRLVSSLSGDSLMNNNINYHAFAILEDYKIKEVVVHNYLTNIRAKAHIINVDEVSCIRFA